ncbi:Plant lipid transfer protein/Par allergen [Macleaya cordata]|uniref:Plant lipid transfer protein/Par allergen n=1 Tax=Macleaya cordata TaxID=56857 RepID=A0A200QUI9_MACCD|nr:Plant lipid transfer protein/Par allergen [Macleaya cordata]
MGSIPKGMKAVGVVVLMWAAVLMVMVGANIECSTVTVLVATCSNFITYGAPEPTPGSPCCDALLSLNNLADSTDNRISVCRCLMGLVTTYNPNTTAITALPGFCGISLGFTIDPNTACN